MKTLLLVMALPLIPQAHVSAAKVSSGQIKTVVTAITAGASAVGFGESAEKEELRKAYRNQGIEPVISATFDVEIHLNKDADAVRWADNIGSADIFFVMQNGAQRSLAPFKFGGFNGGTIRMRLQGNIVQPEEKLVLHLYDDDTVWGDAFSALLPKKISATAGILTPVGDVGGQIGCELQGGHVEIKDPDYIGAVSFLTPNEKKWTVSGRIEDQYAREIGSFTISQHPMDRLGFLHTNIARFIGYSGATIAALIGIPFLISKVRRTAPTSH